MSRILKWLFRETNEPPTPTSTGRTVDMTTMYWGHSISGDGGGNFATWCTPRLQAGDKIRTRSGLFEVIWARAAWEVPDMAFCAFKKVSD